MAGKLDPRFLKPVPDSKVSLSVGATAGKTMDQALTDKSLPIGGAYDSGSCPIGSIIPWAWSTLPTNGDWLECDGSAVSQTTYSALFALIGTTFNTGGEGAGNFRLPDGRGRTLIGVGTYTDLVSGSITRTLGQYLGAEKHMLVTGEMPSHTHTQDPHNHTQNPHNHRGEWSIAAAQGAFAGTWSSNNAYSGHPAGSQDVIENTTATNNSATATNQNTGGGGSHNNMQPSLAIKWIIRWRVTTQGLFLPDGTVPMTGNLQMGNNRITGLGTPTSSTDAATKTYADGLLIAGEMKMYGGMTAPTGYLFCRGQAVSRTTFAALFAAITATFVVNITSGVAQITVSDTSELGAGMFVEGTGIQSGTQIQSVDSATQITVSPAPNATNTGVTIRIAPHGLGDGSTTFNVPDMRGRAPVGSGTGSGLSNRVLGQSTGEENHTLSIGEIPSHFHTSIWALDGAPLQSTNSAYNLLCENGASNTDAHTSSVGGGGSHNNMQPSRFVNFIIKT